MKFIGRSINFRVRSRALFWGSVLALSAFAGSMFAIPAGAAKPGARKPAAKAAAVATAVLFRISQPANSEVDVRFASGITHISKESGTGGNMEGFTAYFSGGFAVDSTIARSGATVDAVVYGEVTPGTPIVGTARLPAGATMTAQVYAGAPQQTITNGRFTLSTSTGVGTGPTSKSQCRHGGWKSFGTMFRNQGDCMSFVATGGKNPPSGS
jgi:hypothetical protein